MWIGRGSYELIQQLISHYGVLRGIKMWEIPILESKRLLLTPLTLQDCDSIFRLFSDEKVMKYYDLQTFKNLDEAQSLILKMHNKHQDNIGFRLAIKEKNTHITIGTCGINSIDKNGTRGVIGYDLASPFWNKGYMTEALEQFLIFCKFNKIFSYTLNVLQADVVCGNDFSVKLLKKFNFIQTDFVEKGGHWRGGFHDILRFELVLNDF